MYGLFKTAGPVRFTDSCSLSHSLRKLVLPIVIVNAVFFKNTVYFIGHLLNNRLTTLLVDTVDFFLRIDF